MLTETLLHTKLTPPPLRPQRVPRPQLEEKLRRALAHPLTLVSAPAGFGKTTAVAVAMHALAAEPDVAVAWLSLDEADNDPIRFWHYFFTAVETAVSLPESLAESLASPQPPAVTPLLTRLLNQIAARPASLLVVLDDYHLIAQKEIHDGVAFLLDHAPPNLHLLLATRADPFLPLHRLRARGQLLEIRADDLRFNDAETAAFLQRTAALTLTKEELALLQRQTEGWAVGLQLAALALQGARDGRQSLIAGLAHNNRYVLEYLTEEVLARQPAPVHSFLLQTAILERLCGPLCDAVTDGNGSEALLGDLAQRNLFILPVSPEGTAAAVPWYRYHHLFAALLQGHLRRQQPQQVPLLHRRAADWFAAQGDGETAVAHALAAADYDLAARIVEENAGDVVMQGRARTVAAWLERLPAASVAAMPRASLAFAQALLLRGQFHEAAPHLQRAAASDLAQRDAAFRGEVYALQATLADTQGDTKAALTYARQALESAPPENRAAQALAHFALAGALRETGDVEAAGAAYAEALPLCRAARLTLVEMLARAHLGFLYTLRGQLHRATAVLQPAAATHHPAAAAILTTLAAIHLERNRLDEAERLLQQAFALVGESGHNAAAVQGHVLRSRLLLARGDAAGAQQALEEAATLFERGAPAWLEPLLRSRQVHFWLAQDDPATADRLLAQANDAIPDQMRDLLQLARARIGVYRETADSLATAHALLAEVLATAVPRGRNGIVIEARLLRALAYAAQDEAQAASDELRQALALAEPEGYVRLFVEGGAPVADLLAAVAHPYARPLLDAFPPEIRAQATAVSPLPDSLTDREADVLRLMARGLTYRQIAAELIVSVNTVRHHVKGLYGKLAVNSRAQALSKAHDLNLL